MKVLVLGSTGLLGSAVGSYFERTSEFETFLSYRNSNVSFGKNKIYFDALTSELDLLPQVDYLINCIGIIKPFMNQNKEKNIYINSVFPHKLASFCKQRGTKMIHITTDCVFDGLAGKYTEDSVHNATDLYGRSKSIGEPDQSMVIRTSIIGEEIHNNCSLIEWAKSMKNKEVNGYLNHIWNGVTTKHYAELCEKIIIDNLYEEGIHHIFSNAVSKNYLLKIISDKFGLNLTVRDFETPTKCDRALATVKKMNNLLGPKPIEQQIKEL